MEDAELILLYDYYGDLLTSRQRDVVELRYNQDLSLGEIGQELGISRQGQKESAAWTEAGSGPRGVPSRGTVGQRQACAPTAQRQGSPWGEASLGVMKRF